MLRSRSIDRRFNRCRWRLCEGLRSVDVWRSLEKLKEVFGIPSSKHLTEPCPPSRTAAQSHVHGLAQRVSDGPVHPTVDECVTGECREPDPNNCRLDVVSRRHRAAVGYLLVAFNRTIQAVGKVRRPERHERQQDKQERRRGFPAPVGDRPRW